MKIAILSDIHSNCFALNAVINEFSGFGIDRIIIAGDIFGYYPWAHETYELLKPFLDEAICIKGNHDQLLLEKFPPHPAPVYWDAAKMNEKQLYSMNPEAISWISGLEFSRKFILSGKNITLVHGTPEDPENGRFYPDSDENTEWSPVMDEIVILGHTHYPLEIMNNKGGVVLNPGSIGQPRDGSPMPSWAILDTDTHKFKFIRSEYDNFAVMEMLRQINWNERAINALNKTNTGGLK